MKIDKVLITGITGFVGSHLADYILDNHPEVKIFGLTRWRSPKDNIEHIINKITLVCGDLADSYSLRVILSEHKPDVIFHLAAQSYVPYSFKVPIVTLNTNVIGTANLLEEIKSLKLSYGYDPIIHVCSCYDEQTELLTKRGFIKYNEIKEDDLVISIDPTTRIISYANINKIIIQDYHGEMKRVKTRSIDLLITPNHKLIFSSEPGRELKFKEVSNIRYDNWDRYYLPSGKYLGKTADQIKVGNSFYDTNKIFYLLGLYIGDGYSDTIIKEVPNKSGLKRDIGHYRYYSKALEHEIEFLNDSIQKSMDHIIRIRIKDIAKTMDLNTKEINYGFSNKKTSTLYIGVKFALFEKGFVVGMTKTKDGEDVFTIKMRNKKDELPISLARKFSSNSEMKDVNIESSNTSISHSYRVFFAIPENDKARECIIKCLDDLGIHYSLYEDQIYFSSKDFVEFFDEVEHSALAKIIPDWIFDYDSKHLEYLYRGLIDSDGYYYETGERFSTSSEKLSESFIKLCIFTGRFVTCSKNEERHSIIGDRIINSNKSNIFTISNNSRMIQGTNISSCRYSGKVWCLEIEKYHNFTVRRNGKTTFCGNSSEVYGQVREDEIPIKETNQFRPASPYAVSKVGEDMLALQYWLSWKVKTIRTRMFTHTGPRRGEVFATSTFAKQIAAIEAGKQYPVVKVGNLDSIRTFLDVKDAVRAYWALVNKCAPGEVYNIGGIETMTVGDMLNKLLKLSTRKDIKIEVDSNRLRPSDVTLQIPSIEKFTKETGWRPEIKFNKTLEDLLNYWRDYYSFKNDHI